MEDFEWTLHRAVKAENGSALAKRMGVNESRLLDCANPNRENHRMSLELFGQVLTHLPEEGRRLVLGALLNEFGYALVEKQPAAPKELTAALLRLHADLADVTRLAFDAQADGHVCSSEKAALLKEADEVVQSMEVFKQSVKAA
ncbi:MAG: phage regulatory CII family protein [Gammaproteobacteria bacterium]|uniref:Putative regulatory protein n=1 Tax=viral metagenome TaxID=1070528 RepID=A0A6M3XEL0_9ZZZZ|nr:phage regulatory CII family protein [Gammaproteobacteria bacterium]MBU2157157.1 phage regulatory CII family protein [Gammaproteobacteria bacterium]MBU2256071.1 phage regulatory CII family protein [Gammaproteobacteria bacterium]MBU2295139.1 phage regulatory CII family protein [Gammaproteobacteria bacterium]